MAIRNIRTIGDPILEKVCKEVKEMTPRTRELIDDMFETMYEANGVGLAAPQVGVLKRIVTIDVGEGPIVLVNPEIIWRSEELQNGWEGCLSVPGRWGAVERPLRVRVKAQDRSGAWFEVEGEAIVARCFCHELDHLDGHLYTEKVSRFLTEEEMEQM